MNLALSHIKLHGALYHVVERDRRLARRYVTFIRERFRGNSDYRLSERRSQSLRPYAAELKSGESYFPTAHTRGRRPCAP